MKLNKYHIAVIPGDGVGNEVVPAAIQVLDTVADIHGGVKFEWTYFPWGCEYYIKHGVMMPEDGIETLKSFDQILPRRGRYASPRTGPHIARRSTA